MSPFAQRVDLIGTEHAFRLGPHIRALEQQGHRVIKCNLGEPDFPVPEHIRAEIKRQIDADNTHYCDPQGLLSLRRAIAEHIARTRDIPVTPDRVVVFPGAKPPIGFAQQAYVDPGDEVVYPSPGFPIYESFVRYVGGRPVPVHLREEKGFALDPDDLAPLVTRRTRLVYLNLPSNPTGGVASPEQLKGLAEVIRTRAHEDCRVYSDEVYEDIIFDGLRHHSIASLPGMAQRTIIVSGVSKSYSWTGGRIGWAVFPTPREAQLFTELNINYFSCVPPYNQEAARLALEAPESRPAIARMVQEFQRRRDFMVPALNAIDGITCQTPRGAFYVFPNIAGLCRRSGVLDAYESLPDAQRSRTTPSTIFQMFLLYHYHVATMDRRSFGRIGSEGRHYLRISIATGLDDLRQAVQRIARAADDRDGLRRFVAEGKNLH